MRIDVVRLLTAVWPLDESMSTAGDVIVAWTLASLLMFGAFMSIYVSASIDTCFVFNVIDIEDSSVMFPSASIVNAQEFPLFSVFTLTTPVSYISMSLFFTCILWTYASSGCWPALALAESQLAHPSAVPSVDAKYIGRF